MIYLYWKRGEAAESGAFKEQILGKGKTILKGAHGKPYLEGGPYFNLSHSGGLLALAIGEQELGLDLEAPRPIRHKGFIQEGEEGIEPLTLWVVKESFMKFTGKGISQFRAVRAEQLSENFYRVTDGEQTAFAQTFWIENCVAAIAMEKMEEITEERID